MLVCTSADGLQQLPPFVLGSSSWPKYFRGRESWEWGFDYKATSKAWMNQQIFTDWLVRFNTIIALTPVRQVKLFLDNAFAHWDYQSLPILPNVYVYFLPKRTTSILQPLDAGVIAFVKKRYRRCQLTLAVDLLDLVISLNPYRVDLKVPIDWLYDVWRSLPSKVIRNCWTKTGLLG